MLLGSTMLAVWGTFVRRWSSLPQRIFFAGGRQAVRRNIVSNRMLQPAVDAAHRHHQWLLQHGRRCLSGPLIGVDRPEQVAFYDCSQLQTQTTPKPKHLWQCARCLAISCSEVKRPCMMRSVVLAVRSANWLRLCLGLCRPMPSCSHTPAHEAELSSFFSAPPC